MTKMCKGLGIMAASIILAAAAGQAGAETRFAVQDSTGTMDKMVITDSGNIGIGTTSPNMAITIDKTGTTGETSIMFHNKGVLPYNQYNSGAFFFMRNNDQSVNSGLPNSGDRLGSMSFGSFYPTAYKYGANISSYAQGTWTSTSFPGFLSFATTGLSGVSPAERMRIDSEGNIGIGTSSPTQKLEVKGGIRLNTASTRPTVCDGTSRGVVWVTQGGTGEADTVDICLKEANGNYRWVQLN